MLTAATDNIGITVARANMAAAPETVSVTIPKAQLAEAARLAAESRRDPQAVLEELVEESIRMRRVPGIVFADGATGRRARIAGTGLEVFEIIDIYKQKRRDWKGLKEWFDWLDASQLRAALEYYAEFPGEIDARLGVDERAAIEALWDQQPRTSPSAC